MTGLRLGVFVVQAPLGAGGMGVVYRALDTNLNRPVAIKFLSDELADPTARRRFQREAQTASSLNHPHIVTVHDAGEFEGRQYLVTEFVDGGTLRDWARGAKRGWRQTIELLTGVADGLAAAHEAGILHRDIKPENILITKSGYAKLARLRVGETSRRRNHQPKPPTVTDRARARESSSEPRRTCRRSRPQASPSTPAAIFSPSASCCTKRWPDGDHSSARPISTSLHAVVHRAAEPLPEDVPLPLRMIVEKALEKDPADRFQTMRDMVVDLRRVARQSAEATPGLAAVPRPKRGRLRLATVAALVVVLAAAGALIVSRFRQPAEPARREYTQLTNFADSATDAGPLAGRPHAGVHPGCELNASFGPGQVYVKLLPDGEPVQLTRDNLFKGNPKFSPDGARIAYSTASLQMADVGHMDRARARWAAAAVLDQRVRAHVDRERNTVAASPPSVLFSEFTGRGIQMSIVSSTESRAEHRTVYMPPEIGMAHRSYLSPDGSRSLWLRWAPVEGRIRVAALPVSALRWQLSREARRPGAAHSAPTPPGPPMGNGCISPRIQATGITSGGSVFRTGRPSRSPSASPRRKGFISLPTDVPSSPQSAAGRAPCGSTIPAAIGRSPQKASRFSRPSHPTARSCITWPRDGGTRNFWTGGLWVADLESGQRQRLLPDFQMRHYTISADGQRVVFVASDEAGRTPVWLAALNGRSAPRRLTTIDSFVAYFGAPGEVVFDAEENGATFIHRIKDDGSELQKLLPTPNLAVFAVSPDGRWVSAETPTQFGATMVYPAGGDPPTLICGGCNPPQGTEHGACPSELDAGREIPLSDFCRLHVCDSSAAGPDVAAHTGRRISVKGSCRRLAGSAADLGRERVSGAQSIDLCLHESVHAPQHLPGSRTVIVSPCRAITAYVAAAVVSLQGSQPRTLPITFTDVTARCRHHVRSSQWRRRSEVLSRVVRRRRRGAGYRR